jgi:hypothetical protein
VTSGPSSRREPLPLAAISGDLAHDPAKLLDGHDAFINDDSRSQLIQ